MDKKALQYYKVIGLISNAISKVDTFQDALKESLKIVLENSAADYAVVWYANKNKDNLVRPYYWICPVDLTNRSYAAGEGIVGKTYSEQNAIVINDFDSKKDADVAKDFAGIDIATLCCVPFEFGCVEFLTNKETGNLTDEEVDVCQILTMMAEISLKENANLPDASEDRKVLMSVSDIKKEYKNGEVLTRVLKGVNFDVFEGEFLCLLGESGCGKSTVLNIIGGMDSATSGKFTYLDKDLSKATNEELTSFRRDNIGFIFQSYNLMPNLTVSENLDLIAELVSEPRDTMDTLKLVNMNEKAGNYPSQLSGGQQQRVSIARALVKNPKIILADEPTAALDYATSIEVLTALEDVVAAGTTLVMVTHNEEITKMANRVIRLRDGKVYEITVNHNPVKATELVW